MVPQVSDIAQPSGLGLRLVSALVLAPAVLAIVYFGYPYFEVLVAVGAALLTLEWRRMIASVDKKVAWWAFGLVYISVPCFALVWLRGDPALGRDTLFWLFGVVWAADSGAYLAGRTLGGPKLAPSISPKKTWSGLMGGLLASGIVGTAIAANATGDAGLSAPMVAFGVSAGIGLISAVGDLLESGVKRRLGVKDSGALIPGHGGLFDRVDGLLFGAFAVALIGWASESNVLTWF